MDANPVLTTYRYRGRSDSPVASSDTPNVSLLAQTPTIDDQSHNHAHINISDDDIIQLNTDKHSKPRMLWWISFLKSIYITLASLLVTLHQKAHNKFQHIEPSNLDNGSIEENKAQVEDENVPPFTSTPSPPPILTDDYYRISNAENYSNSILLLDDNDELESDTSQDFGTLLKNLLKSNNGTEKNKKPQEKRQYGTYLSLSSKYLSKFNEEKVQPQISNVVSTSLQAYQSENKQNQSELKPYRLANDDNYNRSILNYYNRYVPQAPISIVDYSILDNIIPNHHVDTQISDNYTNIHNEYMNKIDDRAKQDVSAITALSETQLQKVLSIWKSNLNKLIISNFQIDIMVSDLKTLSDGSWLNDNVIDYYLNLIMVENSKVYGWTTHFYTTLQSKGYQGVARWAKRRKLNLFEKELIIVPINILNTHWALALIDNSEQTITYFDSLTSSGNRKVLQDLNDYMNQEAKRLSVEMKDYKLIANGKSPQQANGYDCGVFTCTNARLLAYNKKLSYSQKDMKLIRRRMTLEICNNKLLD